MKFMVGFESEYLSVDKNGEFVFPHGDRDSYPLLGECRGNPSESPSEAAASLLGKLAAAKASLGESKMALGDQTVPISVHKEALRRMDEGHNKQVELDKCKNIYGHEVDSQDAAVMKDGAKVGFTVSCGLHVHFSAEDVQVRKVEIPHLTSLELPLKIGPNANHTLMLWKKDGYDVTETITVRAGIITKPVVTELVRMLDNVFFDTIPAEERSKYAIARYRQRGFWEPKPWGFEYRSLPALHYTLGFEVLNEIGARGLKFLKEISIQQ
jgi:hypothetical protein